MTRQEIISFFNEFLDCDLETEINKVHDIFIKEVEKWEKRKAKIRLMIIAESPLSANKYFYAKEEGNNNFLLKLKEALGATDRDFKSKLREKGIFVFDVYEYPIPSAFYKEDEKRKKLYNQDFIKKQIEYLKEQGILSNDTIYFVRYKMLQDRGIEVDGKQIDMKTKSIQNKERDSKEDPIKLTHEFEEILKKL